jgi:aspartate racemase
VKRRKQELRDSILDVRDLIENANGALPEEKEELLALLLEEEGLNTPGGRSLEPRGPTSHPSLSFAQERLWFLDQWEPGNPGYNIPFAVRLGGLLNLAALEQSFEEILRRHQVLRATFASVGGQSLQSISLEPNVLSVVGLQNVPETKREVKVQQLVREEAQRPFDLARGPLLRARLLQLGEEEHVLLLTMHHIISDGWSMGVLLRELSVLYKAFSTGQPSPLPEIPVQYADYAAWQRDWLQGEVLEAQLAYWKQQLDAANPVLDLPTDRPRPAVETHCGARQTFDLPQSLYLALRALSRQEDVTLFMTLLAAFKTLLYRYTGQEDIAVGSPIANRTQSEIEGLIGFFVNTLVLRTGLSGNPAFRELLERVREVALGAYAHQDMPFEKLVEELQPERDLSHHPLFQVMFIFQNTPRQTLELPGLVVDHLEVDNGTAKFDLTLSMVEDAEGLKGTFEYNTDLFDEATVTRMADHFQVLLEGVVADPDQRLSGLPLLTDVERHQLLVEWNETQAEYPEDKCIHELFEAQVEQTPEATAVIFEEERLTYQKLNCRANQLAHHLRGLGVGPEVLVGICLERSLEMVIGLLGILKAGGAYVPLDPAYPKERLASMLEDAEVPVLLTQARLAPELPDHGAKIVSLDTDWTIIARESDQAPVSRTTADNLAYVIYTSGSTGKPKGVQILHRAVVNFLTSMRRQPGLTDQDALLSVTTLSFDIAVLELFLPLSVGARTVVVSREVAVDGDQLAEKLASSGANVMQATPATWRILLEAGWGGSEQLRILCGGEALPRELADSLLERGASLWNLYGPTETTIWSTVHKIRAGNGPLSVGRPIANTQVYILDDDLQPLPVGVPGQLYIGGDGLARGYHNRPELTREKFIPEPFKGPGVRIYSTGDMARYLPDGNIELLGRIDHQVKIRGFRIELGEIEATLSQHPDVRQTVVIVREDTPSEKRLVAYVVPRPGRSPTVGDLRTFLGAKLPEYMVPSVFVMLEALPLTPNGKVNRRALPAPDTKRPELEKAFVTPRDTLELQLVKIWEEILGVQAIGVRDNFFELGGHSLLSVRLLARIKEELGAELPLATLFQAPTVEQLADVLRESQIGWQAPRSSLVAIQPGGSKPPFFCVPGNLGNVFVDLGGFAQHLGPDQPFYGLQDGIQNPIRIEALAAHYIDEMQAVQPEGPYFLGGVCSGGVVAFEMAQQLLVQGQKVALLALVEPSPPPAPSLRTYFRLGTSILRRVVQRFDHHSRSFAQPTSGQWRTYAHLKAKLVANMWAVASYPPQTYPGCIDLFLGNESLAISSTNSQLGWRDLAAGGLEIHAVPGNHATITRTYDAIPDESQVRLLAEALKVCIDGVMTQDVHRQNVID